MSDHSHPYNGSDSPQPSASDILGFDPFEADFLRTPYTKYREMRRRGALFRTPVGLYVATTHAHCSSLLRDPRFGHGAVPIGTGNPSEPVQSFLRMDPPDHTRLRALVSRAFTPRMVERLRPRVEAIAAELIRTLPESTDLIASYAYPLPMLVITEMLGVPAADHERFRRWSQTLARSLDPLLPGELLEETLRARLEFADYFRELIAARRGRPGEDLLSALAQVEELTEEELITTCVLLLVAGHETTVNLIANGVLGLTRHGGLAQAAERPRQVVEEVLRYDPPVQITARAALRDAELGGTSLPAGTPVLALLGGANRDPEVFAEPDRFAPERQESGRHLAFGLGIHFCLGATLARLEGEIALRALAEAAPKLELADLDPPYKANVVLRGLATLPVRLKR
jgi:cytochrome P450